MLGFSEYGRQLNGASLSTRLARYGREILDPRFDLVRTGEPRTGGASSPEMIRRLRRRRHDLASRRRALLRQRKPRAQAFDDIASGLEELTVSQILSAADFGHVAGPFPDPFRLISDPGDASYAFPAARTRRNRKRPLTIPDLIDLDLFERTRDDFPKGGMRNEMPTAVHVIWMGGPFTRDRGQERVATWNKVGKVANRFLWTDRSLEQIGAARGTEKRGYREMEAFCRRNRFVVLCVDQVFDRWKPMRLQHLFDLLRLQREWAAASDILRYELLYRFGGAYADTDVSCLEKIDWHRVREVPNAPAHRFGMGQMHDDLPVQAALFCTSRNPVLASILDFIQAGATRETEQMLRYTPRARAGADEYNYTQRRMDEILARTGPTAAYVSVIAHFLGTRTPLRELFPNFITVDEDWALPHEEFYGIYSDRILAALTDGDPEGAGMPNTDEKTKTYFRDELGMGRALLDIGSEASWLGVRRTPVGNVEEARIALTTLLFRLQADPTLLDLVPLEHTRSNATLITEVVKALTTGFPDSLDRTDIALLGYQPHGEPQHPIESSAREVRRHLESVVGFDFSTRSLPDRVKERNEPAGRTLLSRRYAFR